MKLRARAVLPLFALAAVCLFGRDAHACSCVRVSPCQSAAYASAVFVGYVTRVAQEPRKFNAPEGDGEKTYTVAVPVAHFRVEEVLLGKVGDEAAVSAGGTSCDYMFREGARYLVYAGLAEDGKTFGTSICSGTKLLAEAGDDLLYLRGEAREVAGGAVTGQITRQVGRPENDGDTEDEAAFEPYRGVEVIFEADGRRLAARTDDRGHFALKGVPAGRYKVRTDPPTNDSNARFYDDDEEARLKNEPRAEWNVSVPGHGCVELWFIERYEGEISGEVTGLGDTPLGDVEVQLLPADAEPDADNILTVSLDERRRFSFAFLAPGRYYLGFNLLGDPSLDFPYPEFYFPGVGSRAAAQVIALGAGQKTRGLTLPLPARLAERLIRGVAVWPDGRPAAGISIELTDPKTGFEVGDGARADALGRFEVKALVGQTYELSALIEKKDGPSVNSRPLRITVRANNKPVRLVVVEQ